MLSNTEFKALIRKGAHPHEAIRKDLAPQGVADTGNRTLRFVVSTNDVDRDLDTIRQSGWQLDDYRSNPVVLLHHNQQDWPIGKAVQIDVVEDQLVATVEFVPADVPLAGPIAECAYQLCKSGFLGAVSVGFVPGSYELSDDDDRSKNGAYPGVDHLTQTLLEFSIVTVPSNAQALLIDDEPTAPDTAPDAAPDLSDTITAAVRNSIAKARRERILAVIDRG